MKSIFDNQKIKVYFTSNTCIYVIYLYLQETNKKDPHQLRLARLDWELEQRKM